MKKWIAALGACAALFALRTVAFAHGYDAGDAALGGFVGGVVGGLIGSGRAPVAVAPAPVVVAPYAAPTLVYGARPGRYYSHGHYYPYRHHRHWDDD